MIALGCYTTADRLALPLMARMKAIAGDAAFSTAALDHDLPFAFAIAAHDHLRITTPRGRLIHVLGHAYDLGTPEQLDALLDARHHLHLTSFSGDYVLVIWDPDNQALSLVSDSSGSIALYYAAQRGGLLWGTSLRDFASDPSFSVVPSPEGLVSFLQLGHAVGTSTLVEGVNALGPREWLIFERGQLHRSARPLPFTTARWHVPLARLVDEFYETLSGAVGRRLSTSQLVALLLSGGLDSRLLVGLLAGRVRLMTLTYGRWSLRESQLARRIARAVGTSNRLIPYRSDFLTTHGPAFVESVDGQLNVAHAYWMRLAERIPKDATAVGGFFLGALSGGGAGRYLGEARDYRGVIDSFLHHYSSHHWTADELAGLVRPKFNSLVRSYVRRTLADAVSGYEYPFQAALAVALDTRESRLISCVLQVYRQRTSVIVPGTEGALLDFVCSLPPLALNGQYLYREVFRRQFRRLARVAYANDGLPVQPNLLEEVRTYSDRWVRRILAPIVPSRFHLDRTNVAYLAHWDSTTVGLLAHLPELEAGIDLISDYICPEIVSLYISRFRREGTGGEKLRALLSLVWCFRHLCGWSIPRLEEADVPSCAAEVQ